MTLITHILLRVPSPTKNISTKYEFGNSKDIFHDNGHNSDICQSWQSIYGWSFPTWGFYKLAGNGNFVN